MLSISVALADLLAPRIFKNVEFRPDGCWNRTAYVNPGTGYSHIARMVNGEKTYYLAHRVVWVHFNGREIPEGLTIDHECVNATCINPRHLRAMTHRENVLRGENNPFAVQYRRAREGNGDSKTAPGVASTTAGSLANSSDLDREEA